MKCSTCGKELDMYEEACRVKLGECSSCNLWRERLAKINKPNTVIIDGTFYTIGDENSTDPFRGFGGDKFVINFKDGRQVTTTNLWCGGDVPEYWKPQFPDNADFDWKWKKFPSGTRHLVPK